MDGNLRSWATMKKYNIQDVVLLERVFEKMRGHATAFPDANMWTNANCCPVCQSSAIQHRGYNVSKGGRKQRFQCQDCGNWFALGKAVKSAA
jgi:transposase-like protein